MKRFGSKGGLREGNGSISTESGALENHPYTFFSRYGETPGTNPEELLGAAHAACFTMSFVRMLGMANFVPEWVDGSGARPTTLSNAHCRFVARGAELDGLICRTCSWTHRGPRVFTHGVIPGSSHTRALGNQLS
jgi:hypothetical protein